MTKELKVTETEIPGLLIIDLPVHGDNRGWFKENWQREKMVAAGLPDFNPAQNNISFNASVGTTRGIHAEPWDKYVSVATGRIFGAWVDLRAGESFGKVVTVELGPDTAIFVPRGVGNSFQTLEENTAYTYLVNDHWSADAVSGYSFLNLADETVAIDWPIDLAKAELSEKDRNHPRLNEIKPLEADPILIIGAGGQLGTELVRQLTEQNVPFLAVDRDRLDLGKPEQWRDAFRWRSFRAVINAAAYTAVDQAETPAGRRAARAPRRLRTQQVNTRHRGAAQNLRLAGRNVLDVQRLRRAVSYLKTKLRQAQQARHQRTRNVHALHALQTDRAVLLEQKTATAVNRQIVQAIAGKPPVKRASNQNQHEHGEADKLRVRCAEVATVLVKCLRQSRAPLVRRGGQNIQDNALEETKRQQNNEPEVHDERANIGTPPLLLLRVRGVIIRNRGTH